MTSGSTYHITFNGNILSFVTLIVIFFKVQRHSVIFFSFFAAWSWVEASKKKQQVAKDKELGGKQHRMASLHELTTSALHRFASKKTWRTVIISSK